MQKKIIYLLFFSIILFACNNKTGKETIQRKTFIVLFDVSISIDEQIMDGFIQNFKTVMSAAEEGDVLIAGLISDKSLSENKLPINFTFPIYEKKTDNPMYEAADKEKFDQLVQKNRDSVYYCVEHLLNSKELTAYTDIFGGLQLAQKIYSNYPDNSKVLVIMSDMKESDKVYDFEKAIPDENKTVKILEDLTAKRQMPELTGVRVYVSGANTNDTDSFNKLQHFWVEYFKAAKADFTADRFCATLIKFDE